MHKRIYLYIEKSMQYSQVSQVSSICKIFKSTIAEATNFELSKTERDGR